MIFPRCTSLTIIQTYIWALSVRTPQPATQRTSYHADGGLSICLPIIPPWYRPSNHRKTLDAIFSHANKVYWPGTPQSTGSHGLARGWTNWWSGPVGDARGVGVGWHQASRDGAQRNLFCKRPRYWSQGMRSFPSIFWDGARSWCHRSTGTQISITHF